MSRLFLFYGYYAWCFFWLVLSSRALLESETCVSIEGTCRRQSRDGQTIRAHKKRQPFGLPFLIVNLFYFCSYTSTALGKTFCSHIQRVQACSARKLFRF